jgi:hypothetical protein
MPAHTMRHCPKLRLDFEDVSRVIAYNNELDDVEEEEEEEDGEDDEVVMCCMSGMIATTASSTTECG